MLAVIIGYVLIAITVMQVHAAVANASVAIANEAPKIDSITTYSMYVNDSVNTPATNFSAFVGVKTVYIQIKASDPNGFEEIRNNGSVKVKIVFWNGTTETTFTRFGESYLNATFESGSGTQVIYTYSFEMNDSDPSRLGTETPPLYYRVKGNVTDGEYVVTSNLSDAQNADYTYMGLSPLFDVTVDIPKNKKVVEPGDSVYATVTITKISHPGEFNISITYQLINPYGYVVDSLTEMVAINTTIWRIPLLYLPSGTTEGTYKFRATVHYLTSLTSAEGNFKVKEPAGVGRRRPLIAPMAAPSIDVYGYPDEISIIQGERKLFLVIVENTGDLSVKNVIPSLSPLLSPSLEPMIGVEIIPPMIEIIEPGSKTVFIVDVNVSENLTSGEYELLLRVNSTCDTVERYIQLFVSQKPVERERRERLRREIENIKNLIDIVWNESVEVGSDGKDVVGVFEALEKARGNISLAEDFWKTEKYNETEKYIREAKISLEAAVTTLADAQAIKEVIEKVSIKEIPVYIFPLTYKILFVISILIILGLLYKTRRLEKGLGKGLR